MKRYYIILLICALGFSALMAVPPQIEIQGGCYHDFGDQYKGYDSAPAAFVIDNNGDYNLHIYNLIFDTPSSAFSILDGFVLPHTIAPGETDTLYVIFHPLTNATYIDTLWVINNDPLNKELPITLKGKGIRVPPSPVQNLSINLNGENVNLTWNSVTTNILGGAVDPIYYLVQYSEDGLDEHFWNLAIAMQPAYTHYGATLYANQRFYRVKTVWQIP